MLTPSETLTQELNGLRIKYGTTAVYRVLIGLMRHEYNELHELFTGSLPEGAMSAGHLSGLETYAAPLSASDYYSEFMELTTKAAHETLEEQCYSLHPADIESVDEDNIEDMSEDEDADIVDDISISDVDYVCQTNPEANIYSAVSELHAHGRSAPNTIKVIHTSGDIVHEDTQTPTVTSDMDDNIKEIITEHIPKPIQKKKKRQGH